MARNRGVNDPGVTRGERPRALFRVVHATVPGVCCRVTDAARNWAQLFRTAQSLDRGLSVGANDKRLPRFRGRKALQNLRHQWAQFSERIVRRNEHNHRDIERRKILLILELLIDGHEHIEFVFGDAQLIAIAFAVQPISGTVLGSWRSRSRFRRRGTHSSSSTRKSQKRFFGFVQCGDGLFVRYRRKVFPIVAMTNPKYK